MLNIDRNRTYIVSDYKFVNYTQLTREEKIQILELRNREIVRKWMFSTDIINEEDHFCFIKQLENRNDAFYWAIQKDNRIVACFNITNVNMQACSCETGMFFSNTSLGGFQIILETFFSSYHLLFCEMGIRRVDVHTNINNKFILVLNQYAGFKQKASSGNNFYHQYIDDKLFLAHQQKKSNIRDFLKLLRNQK